MVFAGPEAKPVGPVTLDELHACRVSGIVKPDTYVIEHTGQPVENWAWKRYQEVFPSSPNLPSLPPLPPPSQVMPSSPAAQPHPLFPSATPVSTQPPVFPPGARPDPYYNVKPTNGWCAWGFGLGLTGFFLAFACGVGLLPALLAFPLCIVGLAQVHKHREQSGQGMAIAGLILSSVALIVSLIFIAAIATHFKMHDFTVTEQTSNDSE